MKHLRVKLSCLSLLVLALLGRAAPMEGACPGGAGIPCDMTSVVGAVQICPKGLFEYRVLIRDEFRDPVAGVLVELDFTHAPYPTVGVCGGGSPASCPPGPTNYTSYVTPYTGVLEAPTDVDGFARFHIEGSGSFVPTSSDYIEVRADGVVMKQVGILSADVVNPCGEVHPDGVVALSDAVTIQLIVAYCVYGVGIPRDPYLGDYNQDGRVGLADLHFVMEPIREAAACDCLSPPCVQ